jgi:hypothetical protein
MSSKVNIISNAICMLGHAPIVSLTNQDSMVTAAEQAFDFLLPAVLSSNNWRFSCQIQQLSQSIEVPPEPWATI